MSSEAARREQKRQVVLERLRARRGMPRRQTASRDSAGNQHMASYLEAFLRPEETFGDPLAQDLARRDEIGADAVRDVLEAARKIRRESAQAGAAAKQAAPGDSQERWDLLDEVGSVHFKENIQSWLSAIGPEHGVSSTALEDLERRREEVAYRLRVLKTLHDVTQAEVDELDVHIRAKRTLQT